LSDTRGARLLDHDAVHDRDEPRPLDVEHLRDDGKAETRVLRSCERRTESLGDHRPLRVSLWRLEEVPQEREEGRPEEPITEEDAVV